MIDFQRPQKSLGRKWIIYIAELNKKKTWENETIWCTWYGVPFWSYLLNIANMDVKYYSIALFDQYFNISGNLKSVKTKQ